MVTITRTTQLFKDLDLAFSAHPNTKDLAKKTNVEAIKQSLKNLLLTQYFERPFHSEIGSPVRVLLFELATPLVQQSMQRAIIDVIQNFEPRVTVEDVYVFVQDETNSVIISVTFVVVGFDTLEELELTLERTR
jgi:phage baseplate assembly protein W